MRFGREHSRAFPWRATGDHYSVLVGEVLLQRTSGAHVLRVYDEFLRRFPTPDALAVADPAALREVVQPLGLAGRAPLLIRLGQALRLLGGVPRSPGKLLELPAVGRYTAHAVRIFAGNRNLPLVDWVIARVLRRYFGLTGGARPNADEDLWSLAAEIASVGRAREVWLGTLDLAALLCRSKPRCSECPLARTCAYPATSASELAPR